VGRPTSERVMGSLVADVWKLAVVVMLLGAALAALLGAKRGLRPVRNNVPPYFGKKPLAESERELYARLREAMPECVVLAQVALSSLVETKEKGRIKPWFNRIAQKSVDFVLCLPQDFTVVAVIELDDRTHQRADRRKADATKDEALKIAGHPILRFKVREMPSVEQIRAAIAGDASVATRA
jgi:hypothetical protein